jgi:hypothetical protein
MPTVRTNSMDKKENRWIDAYIRVFQQSSNYLCLSLRRPLAMLRKIWDRVLTSGP